MESPGNPISPRSGYDQNKPVKVSGNLLKKISERYTGFKTPTPDTRE